MWIFPYYIFFFLQRAIFFWNDTGQKQNSVLSGSLSVAKYRVIFEKWQISDKKLPKMPIMWNSWPKNAKSGNPVHTTLFLGMLPQKRKQILRGLLFSVMCYLNYKKENNQCYLWQKSKQNTPKTFDLLGNLAFFEKVTL